MMVADKAPAGEAPPSLGRDRIYGDRYDYFDYKKPLLVWEGAPAPAGEGPPTLSRGPHPY